METTRKNFNFDSRLIEKAEMKAIQSKRSLTKYIEFLIEKDLEASLDEFFDYIDKRNESSQY